MSIKFSREQLTRKLRDLTESQNSISTLSLWLLHHKKFAVEAAKVWFDELKRTKGSRQLILLYLANDVIQNGKRKGSTSEYIKTFQKYLVPAMAECGKHPDHAIRPKIQRIIQIWESREIFDIPFILALRQSLTNGKVIKPDSTKIPRTAIEPESIQEKENQLEKIKSNRPISPVGDDGDDAGEGLTPDIGNTDGPPPKLKKSNPINEEVETMLSFFNSSTVDSDEETKIKSSMDNQTLDYYPPDISGDDITKVTPESLVDEITQVTKDPPSFDSATRRRITELPREVQDPDAVESFHKTGKLEPLLNVIEFGSEELKNYNERLEKEIMQRQFLNYHLKLVKEKMELEQADSMQKMKISRAKLIELKSTRVKLDKRIQSLPDLSSFRKVNTLPQINDLFS